MNDSAYNPDTLIKAALVSATSGLDLDQAGRVLQDAIEAMAMQAQALKEAKYDSREWGQVAKALAHTAKVVDEVSRLVAFAKGQPDSRPDLSGYWLSALTDEQLRQVERWVEENERRERDESPVEEHMSPNDLHP